MPNSRRRSATTGQLALLCFRLQNYCRGEMMGMKSWPLSVLIAVGMTSLISQLLFDTRAARFVDDYPLVCRGTESFKLDPEAPCAGCTKVNTEEPLRYVAFTF